MALQIVNQPVRILSVLRTGGGGFLSLDTVEDVEELLGLQMDQKVVDGAPLVFQWFYTIS